MAEDVVPGLLSDIAADYAAAAEREPMRQAVADKIQHGTARLSDVHDYAEGTGRALSSALTGNLTPEKLPDGTLYYNIADRTITPMARQSCEEINRAAEEILALQDARDGVNLKAVPADFPAERVTGLVDKASDAGEGFAGWLEEPIVNLCEHVADSFMKANADFRYKAGMSPRIRRDSGARCCDWCADLDGVYDYRDAPKEVYARHEFCRCVVTFENGRERQNVWTKERWTADQDELDRRREYGLTDERERGIVKADLLNTRITHRGKVLNPMSKEDYNQIVTHLRSQGIKVYAAVTGDDLQYMLMFGAEGTYSNGLITHIGETPSRGTFFEEIIHMHQARQYGELNSSDFIELYAREIEANRKLLKYQDAYKLDRLDIEDITKNLTGWENQFKAATGVTFDESNYRGTL